MGTKKVVKVLKTTKKVSGKVVRFFAKFFVVLFFTLLISGCTIGTYIGLKLLPMVEDLKTVAYDKLDSIGPNTFTFLADTVIYANDGSVISETNTGNYQYVEINNVSKWIQSGYIAVEDRRFKVHNGIDYKALTRAGLTLLKNKGEITQGGSTITQQVIKNNLLTQEKSYKRKIIEFFIAPEIEKKYTKQEIMEFYVNTNFYGNNCYGVETASQYYFGKPCKELSISEAAMLVGMSNNANYYNPKKNYDAVIEKRDFVLKIMMNEGVITKEEYDIAKADTPNLLFQKDIREKESYQTSYAIHCATLELMKKENFEFKYIFEDESDYNTYRENYVEVYTDFADKIRGGGYSIYTSLDNNMQNELQSIIDKSMSGFNELSTDGSERYAFQSSAVLVNNQTGFVEAIVGGRGTDDEYNRGFLSKRQPGSAIKPLVVYAPSFNTGLYYPSLVMEDKDDTEDKYYPKNYNGGHMGDVSIREAVGKSINTIAYQLMKSIGPNEGLNYLGKMRFDSLSYEDKNNTAVALGGFTFGARIVDMAKGYSTLANMGDYIDNTCIKEIEYQNEGSIFKATSERISVYDEDAAYLMVDVLKGVLDEPYGTGARRQLKNAIAFAKTGTTNDAKDVWFCGSSAYYSLAVWCGYDMPRATNFTGGSIPGEIWNKMMTKIHMDKPMLDFTKPDSVEELSINYNGEIVDYTSEKKDLFSYKLLDKAEEKQKQLEEEKKIANDNSKIMELEKELLRLEKFVIKDSDSVAELQKDFDNLQNSINGVYQNTKKAQLLDRLTKIKLYFEIDIRTVERQKDRDNMIKELEYQATLEENIAHSLNIFNNLSITSISDISKVEDMYYSLKRDIKKMKNKVDFYLDKLEEIKGYKDILLVPFKEELEKQKEEEKNNLRLELSNLITSFEGVFEYSDNLSVVYSEIDTLISVCKDKKVTISDLESRYSRHKIYLENLKPIEIIPDEEYSEDASNSTPPEGIPVDIYENIGQ